MGGFGLCRTVALRVMLAGMKLAQYITFRTTFGEGRADHLAPGTVVMVHGPAGAAPVRAVVVSSSSTGGGLVVVVLPGGGRAPPREGSVLVTFHHDGELLVLKAFAHPQDEQVLLRDLQFILSEGRRSAPRSLLACGAVLRPDAGSPIAAVTVDLSTSGCRLSTADRLPLRREERFTLDLAVDPIDVGGAPITCTAEVMWNRSDGESCGVWFNDLTGYDRDRLASAVMARMEDHPGSGAGSQLAGRPRAD